MDETCIDLLPLSLCFNPLPQGLLEVHKASGASLSGPMGSRPDLAARVRLLSEPNTTCQLHDVIVGGLGWTLTRAPFRYLLPSVPNRLK